MVIHDTYLVLILYYLANAGLFCEKIDNFNIISENNSQTYFNFSSIFGKFSRKYDTISLYFGFLVSMLATFVSLIVLTNTLDFF